MSTMADPLEQALVALLVSCSRHAPRERKRGKGEEEKRRKGEEEKRGRGEEEKRGRGEEEKRVKAMLGAPQRGNDSVFRS